VRMVPYPGKARDHAVSCSPDSIGGVVRVRAGILIFVACPSLSRMGEDFHGARFHGASKVIEHHTRPGRHGGDFVPCERQFLEDALGDILDTAHRGLGGQTVGFGHALPVPIIDVLAAALPADGLRVIGGDAVSGKA
jgi:hypothetical protein